VAQGHKPLSQSMAFHIKLAATLNAKAKPQGGFCEAKVRCHFKIPAISSASLAGYRYL